MADTEIWPDSVVSVESQANVAGAIHERWACASRIIELVSTCRRNGKSFQHVNFFITTLCTSPMMLLPLVRQHWAIENQWHWLPPLPAKLTPLHFDHQGGLIEQSYASLQRGRQG